MKYRHPLIPHIAIHSYILSTLLVAVAVGADAEEAVVNRLSPTVGSKAGGTRITLWGVGYSEDKVKVIGSP